MTGPSATPAPSWPVASQRPGTARDGPIAGRWSGSHGRRPAQAAATRQRAQAREQARGALDHRLADRGVDARVEAAPLARRADEHVALPRRLDDRGDLQAGVGARDRAQVGAVDDLVADQAGRGAASRTSWPLRGSSGSGRPAPRGERRAPRAGGDHDGARARCRARRRVRDAATPRRRPATRLDARTPVADVAPACAASRASARAIARGSHCRSPGNRLAPCSAPVSSGSRSRTSSGVEQPRGRDAEPLAAARARRPRSPRRGARPARPCGGSAPPAEPRLELAEEREAGERELELGPGVLVRAQHVALAEPGRAARDLAAVEQRHATPRTASSRATAAPTMPAPTTTTSRHSAKPAGNGSSGSSRYWPIAGDPGPAGDLGHDRRAAADRRLPAMRPVKREPITDSLTNAVAAPARRARAAARSAPRCRSRTGSGRASQDGSRWRPGRRRRRGPGA